VLKLDFLLVERDVELVLELVGNRAAGDGAEQLAVLAGLDLDDANQLVERLARSVMWLNSCASRSARFCLSASICACSPT